jgi:hypothetical protein
MDWEQRYAAAQRLFGDSPSELLVNERQRLRPGQRALAVGDGEGRNGIWLAEQGLRVTALDLSPTAQRRAAVRAAQRGVAVELVCTDLFQWNWPSERFDVITCIFVHLPPAPRRRLYELMWQAACPGGLIFIEAYHRDQAGRDTAGPQDPALLAEETELRDTFAAADILRLQRTTTDIFSDGEHRGHGDVIHFVARRPAAGRAASPS